MTTTAPGLVLRKLADIQPGEVRVRGFHPMTGERTLVDPATGQPAPWPLLGVTLMHDVPAHCTVPTGVIEMGVAEGWIELEGERAVHRPGGPPQRPWAKTHTFVHADVVVLKLVEGTLRYRVVHQPDKYHDGPAGTDAVGDPTARVDAFYVLEREG